jgi:site-specific DNA-methyltransferase (adenine-specific)
VKRLRQAESDTSIQGYADGVFWERNSLNDQKQCKEAKPPRADTLELFNG